MNIELQDGGFAALGLHDEIVAALTTLGYEEPTPIQREAIPILLAGKDVLGQAATGTGKTAAFALPLLHRLTPDAAPERRTAALVLVPTRELAMQVAEAIHKYGKGMGVRVLPVYGGAPMEQQLRALRRGVDVVVATPGRALDHVRRKSLALEHVRTVVLDEADEMLDMGFEEDLQSILDETPKERQTALFSATMAPRIAAIAEKHLRNPERVTIARELLAEGAMPRVRQVAYVVPRAHKPTALGRVLDMEKPTSAIVFCRTRTEVDQLTETLASRGYAVEALHGGLSQDQRDRVMKRFRSGTTELLVATDVAARGLDIEHLSHVVNYDVPSAPAAYVHRIGRTGRAGREGVAITFAEPREHRQLRNIEHLTKQKIAVETVPTVADLRARRLALTRSAVEEAILAGEHGSFRSVVEQLAAEYDIMDVAAAAVKLAHEAERGKDDEVEIPDAKVRPGREGRGERRTADGERGFDRSARRPRGDGDGDGGFDRGDRGERRPPRQRKRTPWEATRIFIGAGRKAGVRPGDLVGAIANEAGVDSSAVGAIEIGDRHSLVEVPLEIADEIVSALRSSTIKGKKVTVRRDRELERGE